VSVLENGGHDALLDAEACLKILQHLVQDGVVALLQEEERRVVHKDAAEMMAREVEEECRNTSSPSSKMQQQQQPPPPTTATVLPSVVHMNVVTALPGELGIIESSDSDHDFFPARKKPSVVDLNVTAHAG
jgi:DNA polymerase III epsilon subunit-like protein